MIGTDRGTDQVVRAAVRATLGLGWLGLAACWAIDTSLGTGFWLVPGSVPLSVTGLLDLLCVGRPRLMPEHGLIRLELRSKPLGRHRKCLHLHFSGLQTPRA